MYLHIQRSVYYSKLSFQFGFSSAKRRYVCGCACQIIWSIAFSAIRRWRDLNAHRLRFGIIYYQRNFIDVVIYIYNEFVILLILYGCLKWVVYFQVKYYKWDGRVFIAVEGADSGARREASRSAKIYNEMFIEVWILFYLTLIDKTRGFVFTKPWLQLAVS